MRVRSSELAQDAFICSTEKTNFVKLKFIPGTEACGNKTKEMYNSLLSLEMISFVLFPQVSEPSMNLQIGL